MHVGPVITTPSALLFFFLSLLFLNHVFLSSIVIFFYPHPPSLLLLLLLLLHQPAVVSLCPPPLSLSPALLLTSSAVLRPLHEANAHSGLAVAACMRSTGGPIKRRQEQETERDAGSARPQGPRRYHNWPWLCLPQWCQNPIPDPLYPHPPNLLTWCVSSARALRKTDLRTSLCVSSGCCLSKKQTHLNTPMCVSSALAVPHPLQKIPQPLYS